MQNLQLWNAPFSGGDSPPLLLLSWTGLVCRLTLFFFRLGSDWELSTPPSSSQSEDGEDAEPTEDGAEEKLLPGIVMSEDDIEVVAADK